MVTELVKFILLEKTTDEQLTSKADILNSFQKKQDGFIDAELVKDNKEDVWYLIYHYESMEKVKAIGDKMRSNKVLDEFMTIILPGSLSITFNNQLRKW